MPPLISSVSEEEETVVKKTNKVKDKALSGSTTSKSSQSAKEKTVSLEKESTQKKHKHRSKEGYNLNSSEPEKQRKRKGGSEIIKPRKKGEVNFDSARKMGEEKGSEREILGEKAVKASNRASNLHRSKKTEKQSKVNVEKILKITNRKSYHFTEEDASQLHGEHA